MDMRRKKDKCLFEEIVHRDNFHKCDVVFNARSYLIFIRVRLSVDRETYRWRKQFIVNYCSIIHVRSQLVGATSKLHPKSWHSIGRNAFHLFALHVKVIKTQRTRFKKVILCPYS